MNSNSISRTLIVFIIFAGMVPLSAQRIRPGTRDHYQEIMNQAGEKFRESSLLLNGVYFDDPYVGARGNPYMYEDAFLNGTVTYRGKLYNDVLLKFDIVDDFVIVDHQLPEYHLITRLSNEFLTAFSIRGVKFRKLEIEEDGPRFYQVVSEEGSVKCYYDWRKSRTISHHLENTISYVFSGSIRRGILLLDDEVHGFRNNRTFVSAFPDAMKKSLKSYLRSERIRIRRLDDESLREVLHYAEELLPASLGNEASMN